MTDTTKRPLCELCGEPMPEGEEMFKYHGYSGPCPKPPKKRREITDKDRLDFLDSMAIDVNDLKGEKAEPGRAVVFFAPYDGERPPSIREAIDAAMAKIDPQQPED